MMISDNRVLRWLALALGLSSLLAGAPASAQLATRTWVSGVGSDANACTRTAPCQTFAVAISKTAASGEIDCLDPGGFGVVTITKAITLFCSGLGNGGILAAGPSSGITINAGASDVVIIDGLDIDGAGSTGQFGINFIAGNSLIVRNTVIRNFSQSGIEFSPAVSATLTVDNTTIINVGYNGGFGAITVHPTSAAAVRASVSRSQFSNDSFGVLAFALNTTGSISIDLRDTNITNSGVMGIDSSTNGTALFSTISLDGVTVTGSGLYGLFASGAHSRISVNNSNINNNIRAGVYPFLGGVIYSYGNNRVENNNGNDGAFTGTKSMH
jgi:hypothetical protein